MFDLTTIELMNLVVSTGRVTPRQAISPSVVRMADGAVQKTADKFGETYEEALNQLVEESQHASSNSNLR